MAVGRPPEPTGRRASWYDRGKKIGPGPVPRRHANGPRTGLTGVLGRSAKPAGRAHLIRGHGRTKGNVWAMTIGTVKWFNPTKGYGFVAPEEGGKDIFVHISAVQKAGLRTLTQGEKISFDVESQKDGRAAAVNLGRAQ